MIKMRIKRRGETNCQLKWFAPVWSRFLAIKSSAVPGHDSLRVYCNAAQRGAASRHSPRAAGLGIPGCRGRVRVELDRTVVVLNGLFVPP